MLIVGLNGSPRKARSNTRYVLEQALEAASEVLRESGVSGETRLVDLADYEIRRCTGCDLCVRKKPCPESEKDDVPKLEEIFRSADAIIIGAPSYFTTVPGLLKDFIDRSRVMKMLDNQLRDKVFGAVTYAGLKYGGQEVVIDYLNRYALAQGMIVVGSLGSPIHDGIAGIGSMQTDEGRWRGAKDDKLAIKSGRLLGRRVAEVALRLRGASK
ncbi:MAG: flavodoxin family protein [Candidatus Thorarchaeota archaeon]